MRVANLGMFCALHVEKIYGFVVQKSSLPHAGQGLFTKRKLVKGQVIDCYGGHVHSRKPHGDAYVMCLHSHLYVTGKDRRVGFLARFANHASHGKSNCMFVHLTAKQSFVWLIARRNIAKGEELLVNYGNDYF